MTTDFLCEPIMHMRGGTPQTMLPRTQLNQFTMKLSPAIVDAIITHILNNYVLHDHTSSPHLSHGFSAPSSSRVAN
jgi:hypothetical protein